MEHHARLPDPGADEIAASESLRAAICAAIDAHDGFLCFDEFMARALYTPGLGYYVGGAPKFGAGGDFVTAPEISPLYGACIALQCRQVFERTGGCEILEFGGGTGRLCASILGTLAETGSPPERYSILELSPELRERQRALLERDQPALLPRVVWLSEPPASPICGVVLANEILDALPVRIFHLAHGAVLERGVGYEGSRLVWRERSAAAEFSAIVLGRLECAGTAAAGPYVSEINAGLEPWVADLARFLDRGVALLADYGYPRREYYHPGRSAGTLMCHYRHHAHDDPLWYPGLQDITAHVDFTAVAEAADEAGLAIAGFAEQASFLAACGITDLAAARLARDFNAAHALANELKRLLLPSHMGTRFKIIALARGCAEPLLGFELRDDRHRL
ncbi:MAG: SAM-dependent methyltransferase [Gammaproteobacteria bacterium]|nr:SAM-dependent methyltransferase [Gammaproteobacteria bacterium]MBI5618957.1 SAM-dependent methyltransferase [Gammaproteobacteria bacterium]